METSLSLDHINLDDLDSKARLHFVQELGFFEVLAQFTQKTKVQLTVPETFISGFGFSQPTLICTNYETGDLFVRENVTKVGIYESCAFFEELNRTKGHVPIAVHKTASTSYYHDTCRPVFTPQEATTLWNQCVAQSRPQVLQRYVTGLSKHASMVRATWEAASSRIKKVLFKNNIPLRTSMLGPRLLKEKSKAKSLEQARATFLVLTKSEGVMSAEMQASHSIDSKVQYLISLLEHQCFQAQDLKLCSLEADFIQDEKGFWYCLCSYLVSFRSFRLTKHMGLPLEPLLKRPLAKAKSLHRKPHVRRDSEDERLPRIKQWNKAILKQRELITLVDARDIRKLNKSAVF